MYISGHLNYTQTNTSTLPPKQIISTILHSASYRSRSSSFHKSSHIFFSPSLWPSHILLPFEQSVVVDVFANVQSTSLMISGCIANKPGSSEYLDISRSRGFAVAGSHARVFGAQSQSQSQSCYIAVSWLGSRNSVPPARENS